MIFLTKLIKTV